ncbi:hypothetical protein B0H19DRAFT_1270222 [Mycena capillaripes]|nr:hypothetical protein B0H19DRAFT_1270222 [Mycena capillaripes]
MNPLSLTTSVEGRATLELDREIFEIVALLYSGCIPKLLHVARRVLLMESGDPALLGRASGLFPTGLNDCYTLSCESLCSTVAVARPAMCSLLERAEAKGAAFSAAVRPVEILYEWTYSAESENVSSDAELELVICLCAQVQEVVLIGEASPRPILAMLEDNRSRRLVYLWI